MLKEINILIIKKTYEVSDIGSNLHLPPLVEE